MSNATTTPPHADKFLKKQPTRAQVRAAQILLDQAKRGRGTVKVTPALRALANAKPAD